jgi:hypothetical protein
MTATRYRLFCGVTPGFERLLSAELSRASPAPQPPPFLREHALFAQTPVPGFAALQSKPCEGKSWGQVVYSR